MKKRNLDNSRGGNYSSDQNKYISSKEKGRVKSMTNSKSYCSQCALCSIRFLCAQRSCTVKLSGGALRSALKEMLSEISVVTLPQNLSLSLSITLSQSSLLLRDAVLVELELQPSLSH